MNLKPEEISKVIRSQIKYYSNALEQSEIGTVLTVGDGIVRASGLSNCMAGELLAFENGAYGLAQNLEENRVSIVLLGADDGISEGQTVKRTGKVVSVPVGDVLLGRVVDALGQPMTAKDRYQQASTVQLSVRHRVSVTVSQLRSRFRQELRQ